MSTPTFVQPSLRAFTQALAGLQALALQANVDRQVLNSHFLKAQQHYQQKLRPALEEMQSPALTPYQTEINRSMRLLGMDVAFLQAAQKSPTVQKRQAQMEQRLKSLLDFSQGLAAALESDFATSEKNCPEPGEGE